MSSTFKTALAVSVSAICLAGCTTPNYTFTPSASSAQTVRFDRGTPTILEDREHGSAQMSPLGVNKDGDRVAFGIAVFNKGKMPINFGVENISAASLGAPLKAYTKDELAHEAKVHAGWMMALTVLAGAAAAYSANENAYSTTNGTITSPSGRMTNFTATTYDRTAATVGTAAAAAGTGYTLVSIKHNLDDTLDHLNGAMLQTTTIDPGQSYGGEIVADLPPGKAFPKQMTIHALWNGEPYDFNYQVNKGP